MEDLDRKTAIEVILISAVGYVNELMTEGTLPDDAYSILHLNLTALTVLGVSEDELSDGLASVKVIVDK